MKYTQLNIMKVIKKSDILVVAMSDSKKMVKVLPNNRFTVNCFYHNDKKPSMVVDRKNNRFHCYSCKTSGHVITLLMKAYNLDFITSLETLAQVFDIHLPYRRYLSISNEAFVRLKEIKESEEYHELIENSYIKTLKNSIK